MKIFRSRIFSRIVPTVRDIGLWGKGVQEAFAAMGAIEFADVDAAALLEKDARVVVPDPALPGGGERKGGAEFEAEQLHVFRRGVRRCRRQNLEGDVAG